MNFEKNEDGTWVTVKLSSQASDLLNQACLSAGRAKKREVKLRIEDHLLRFASITEIGKVTDRA